MGIGKNGNLVPNSDLTREERKAKASKAGKASVEAKKRKKTMREALELLMYHTELPEQAKQMLKADGIKDVESMNHQMVITRSLIAKAEAGDVQAYNAICAMIGEKPAEKVEMSGALQKDITITCISKSPEDDTFPSSESEVDAE